MFLAPFLGVFLVSLRQNPLPGVDFPGWASSMARDGDPRETHLTNLRQLTFGGQNAEAYWNVDGTKLTYQTRQARWPDEQIVEMNADGTDRHLVSTGEGRCTCSYFSPDGKWIYFSSTHAKNKGPQPPLDFSKGYVWMINPQYSMYRRPVAGGDLQTILDKPGYIAETTIAPDGKYLTFTGGWEGNVNVYRADLKGHHLKTLVDEVGYNGGPFVSWDSKWIVYRRSAFTSQREIDEFKDLLKQNLVRPLKMEIWIMDADGNGKKQVTHLGCASFAPFMFPDSNRIIFCSNYGDPQGRTFHLFSINRDGSGLEQLTYGDFDGFPMFSRDGKHLAFVSSRYATDQHDTNIFVADWKD